MQKKSLQVYCQYLLPQHVISRLMGKISSCQWSWVKKPMIRWFIRQYQVSLDEAQHSNLANFNSFDHFFTRTLRPETRPINQNPQIIVSPVDGTISQMGTLEETKLMQAKGVQYCVKQLLGGDSELAKPFVSGSFATLYLAPSDYHRVHMPMTGTLREMIYIPGQLFSVNNKTSNQVENLFARNERVVCVFETELGIMAVVFVGAMIVASIITAWAGLVAPGRSRKILRWDYSEQNLQFSKGEEIGYFQMGSTVIMLFEPNRMNWNASLKMGESVKYGQAMGKLIEGEM